MSRIRIYLKTLARVVLLALIVLFPKGLWAQVLPDIPDLIVVTVDHTDNGVLIQWEPSDDNDIALYHLWKKIGNDFILLFSFNATTFQYKHMTSGLENLAYAVVAEDSAGNRSVFADNVHQAVAVSTEFDLCTQTNLIQWTPYMGWEGNISGYKVFGGIEGGPMQELDFVPATTSSFSHSGVAMNSSYIYYIETMRLGPEEEEVMARQDETGF